MPLRVQLVCISARAKLNTEISSSAFFFSIGSLFLAVAVGPCHCRSQTDGCLHLWLLLRPRSDTEPGLFQGRWWCGSGVWDGVGLFGGGREGLKMHDWPYAQRAPGLGGTRNKNDK